MVPTPPGGRPGWGVSASTFGRPLVRSLWQGSQTMVWPMATHPSITWAQSHIHGPWVAAGSGVTKGPHQPASRSLLFRGPLPDETLTLTFMPLQGWTRVSYQIQRIMLGTRPASSYLKPYAVKVVVDYQETRFKHKSIGVTAPGIIQEMTHWLNQLTMAPQGVGGCEVQIPGQVSIRFFYAHAPTKTVIYVPACGMVSVSKGSSLTVGQRLMDLWQKLLAPSPLGTP